MKLAERTRARRTPGFTLIELGLVLLIMAVLATLALPSFQQQLRQTRRSDAQLGLMQLQHAQERWRASHSRYATREELGLPQASSHRHYVLDLSSSGPGHFELVATATGEQQRDERCRVMRVQQDGALTRHLAGPSAEQVEDQSGLPQACWKQ